jgi:hypothetical protein
MIASTTRGNRAAAVLRFSHHFLRPPSLCVRSKSSWSRKPLSNQRKTKQQPLETPAAPRRFLKRDGSKRPKSTLASGGAGRMAPPQPPSEVVVRQTFWQALEEGLRKPRTMPIPRWISPRHYNITFAELLGHASFFLVATSYAVDDFLLLRIIAVAGSTSMLFFAYFHPHGRVLWLPFQWNCLFIAINSYRVGRIFLDRYQADFLSPELLELRREQFYLMDTVDFSRLVRLGTLSDLEQGQVMVSQGEHNRYVRLVIGGTLRVLRDGAFTYELVRANFISESGLHAGQYH